MTHNPVDHHFCGWNHVRSRLKKTTVRKARKVRRKIPKRKRLTKFTIRKAAKGNAIVRERDLHLVGGGDFANPKFSHDSSMAAVKNLAKTDNGVFDAKRTTASAKFYLEMRRTAARVLAKELDPEAGISLKEGVSLARPFFFFQIAKCLELDPFAVSFD